MKKRIALSIIILSCLSALTACGTENNVPRSGEQGSSTATATDKTAETTTATSDIVYDEDETTSNAESQIKQSETSETSEINTHEENQSVKSNEEEFKTDLLDGFGLTFSELETKYGGVETGKIEGDPDNISIFSYNFTETGNLTHTFLADYNDVLERNLTDGTQIVKDLDSFGHRIELKFFLGQVTDLFPDAEETTIDGFAEKYGLKVTMDPYLRAESIPGYPPYMMCFGYNYKGKDYDFAVQLEDQKTIKPDFILGVSFSE